MAAGLENIGIRYIECRHLLSALGEAQAQVRQEFRIEAHADSLQHQHPLATAAEVIPRYTLENHELADVIDALC